MESKPLTQTATRRAINDTLSAQRSAKFMWGGEGVLAVAGGTWLTQIAPIGASVPDVVLRAVIGGLGGLITAMLTIFAWNLLRAPYRQRNEARQRIEELETESENPKLFDVLCPTTSLRLPINRLNDGSYRASSVSLGIGPISIVHRGDLTTITHFIMSPVIKFTRKDGWETTDAIHVTPGRNVMATLLTQSFAWDTNNPQQWVLNGLPLQMAKGETLTLPTMMVSVANGNEAGAHFEGGETCTLLMRFAIRTDKGTPLLPDHQISLTRSDIKDSLSGLGIQPNPEKGTTQ